MKVGKNMFVKLSYELRTDSSNGEIIEKTEVLKPSKWNFQGTKELVNINFIYFTCIDRILKPGDLKQIAMSSDGKLLFLKDNYDIPERLPENFKEIYKDGVLEVSVYSQLFWDR